MLRNISLGISMKYAKELSKTIQRLPPTFQDSSLDYKAWKKRCKNTDLSEAMVLLRSECDRVESLFASSYDLWSSPPSSIFPCFRQNKVTPDPQHLLLYAEVNAKTVYKICKRLQKVTRDPTPMSWLTSLRASHIFEFLGGHHTTRLQLRLHGETLECPICAEDVNHQTTLIYQCGHHACMSCAIQYAKAPHPHGRWYNVLSYAQRWSCPYCRYERALLHATTV